MADHVASGFLIPALLPARDCTSSTAACRVAPAAMTWTGTLIAAGSTVASHMGLPDAGLATYSDMVGRVTAMAGMARAPLIADADTGYGGLLNMRHTIRGYEAAGAAAIQIGRAHV